MKIYKKNLKDANAMVDILNNNLESFIQIEGTPRGTFENKKGVKIAYFCMWIDHKPYLISRTLKDFLIEKGALERC